MFRQRFLSQGTGCSDRDFLVRVLGVRLRFISHGTGCSDRDILVRVLGVPNEILSDNRQYKSRELPHYPSARCLMCYVAKCPRVKICNCWSYVDICT